MKRSGWSIYIQKAVFALSEASELFYMDLSGGPARFTFADALNLRDWRIYHALAMRLLLQVRDFYAKEPTGMKLEAKDNILNSTIINLCSNLLRCIQFQR